MQFYKPNKSNKGTACGFQVQDNKMFVNFIKQFSWDESKKTGSFSANAKNPATSGAIQLTQIEIGAIETNRPYSTFHKNANGTSQIKFEPYIDKTSGEQKGHSFQVGKDTGGVKVSFVIGFSFPEARTLKAYLEFALRSTFIFDEEKRANYKKPEADPVCEAEHSTETGADEQAQETETDVWAA